MFFIVTLYMPSHYLLTPFISEEIDEDVEKMTDKY